MSIIANLEAWVGKLEGEAKSYVQAIVDKVKGDKANAIAAIEAEKSKLSEAAQAEWAKIKALL